MVAGFGTASRRNSPAPGWRSARVADGSGVVRVGRAARAAFFPVGTAVAGAGVGRVRGRPTRGRAARTAHARPTRGDDNAARTSRSSRGARASTAAPAALFGVVAGVILALRQIRARIQETRREAHRSGRDEEPGTKPSQRSLPRHNVAEDG